jgi:multidrug efflux pump subunit AcrB
VFVVALLVVRGLPALLFAKLFDRRSVLAAGLLQATSLPFIVTATQIGVLTGLMSGVTAAAMVCAGLVSVILFPVASLALLQSARRDSADRLAAASTDQRGT